MKIFYFVLFSLLLYSGIANAQFAAQKDASYLATLKAVLDFKMSDEENIKDLKDLTKDDIAIINEEMDEQFYEMAKDVLKENKIKNDLVEYEDYLHNPAFAKKREMLYS